MDGRRYLLKAQLEKERLELERKREEEEARRVKEKAGMQESVCVDVPSPQGKPPAVTVEVPADVLQVSLCQPTNRERGLECCIYGSLCVCVCVCV